MKILHVNHLLDPVSGGGTAERTFQLARFLMKEGMECGVLTLDIGPIDKVCSELKPARIYKLWCLNQRYFVPVFSIFKLIKLIKSFDVVHLMGHWTMTNVLVAMCCMLCHIPYVVCPAGALQPFGRSRYLKKLYDAIIGRRIIRSASGWIAITEAEKKDFLIYGIPAELVEVIPNGVDPEQYQLKEPISSLPAGLEEKIGWSPFFLFLGRLNAIKGPDLLLEAFLQIAVSFPEVHLVLAGPDSGMLKQLQTMAEHSQVAERVHFCGYIGGRDKVNLLQKAYCLVIPSRNEAMSVVVLEAGTCGTPVLFTDRCGLEDFAENGAGIKVEASVDSIYEGLVTALTKPDVIKRSGLHLQDLVSKRYLWSTQAKKYSRLFQKLTLKSNS